jgi:hypothetical protein
MLVRAEVGTGAMRCGAVRCVAVRVELYLFSCAVCRSAIASALVVSYDGFWTQPRSIPCSARRSRNSEGDVRSMLCYSCGLYKYDAKLTDTDGTTDPS